MTDVKEVEKKMCRVGAGEQITTGSVPDLGRREMQSCCRLC